MARILMSVWDGMLERHLAADAQDCDRADAAVCAGWLVDLRVLGLRPEVLPAEAHR